MCSLRPFFSRPRICRDANHPPLIPVAVDYWDLFFCSPRMPFGLDFPSFLLFSFCSSSTVSGRPPSKRLPLVYLAFPSSVLHIRVFLSLNARLLSRQKRSSPARHTPKASFFLTPRRASFLTLRALDPRAKYRNYVVTSRQRGPTQPFMFPS